MFLFWACEICSRLEAGYSNQEAMQPMEAGRCPTSSAIPFFVQDQHFKRCLSVMNCCRLKAKNTHLQMEASINDHRCLAITVKSFKYFKFSKPSVIPYQDLRKWCCASEDAMANGPAYELQEANEAVAQLLKESGLSKEEAILVSSKAINYTHGLMDAVHELDELELWHSWQIESGLSEGEHTSFKDKILKLARRKCDMGRIPYLESIGVNPLLAKHIYRYLLADPLIYLIERVNFLKELLSHGDLHRKIISGTVRRMMMRLSVSADDDLQQTLSFFEKMEARRGGLSILDSWDDRLPCLIESFPKILLRNVNEHLNPLLNLFEGLGVPKGYVGSVILCFPPVILFDIEKDIQPRLRNLKKAGFQTKEVGKMLMKYPWLLSKCIHDNVDDVIETLTAAKVPKRNVIKGITKFPQLLGCLPERLKPMINQIKEFGVKRNTLACVVSSSPLLLLRRPHEFSEVVFFMEELGLDTESMGRILNRCPEIYASSVERTLRRKVKFLIEHGISDQRLQRVVKKYPEVLVKDIDQTVKPLLEYLEHAGLSKENVAFMVSGFPPLLGYSIEGVFEPKLKYLVNVMGRSIKETVTYPRYFSYSLEEKIKPRFRLLQKRKMQCDLKTLLSKNDDEFAEEYLGIGRMLVPLIYD